MSSTMLKGELQMSDIRGDWGYLQHKMKEIILLGVIC